MQQEFIFPVYIGLLSIVLFFKLAAVARSVAQSGSALEWGSRGRWFKSSRSDTVEGD